VYKELPLCRALRMKTYPLSAPDPNGDEKQGPSGPNLVAVVLRGKRREGKGREVTVVGSKTARTTTSTTFTNTTTPMTTAACSTSTRTKRRRTTSLGTTRALNHDDLLPRVGGEGHRVLPLLGLREGDVIASVTGRRRRSPSCTACRARPTRARTRSRPTSPWIIPGSIRRFPLPPPFQGMHAAHDIDETARETPGEGH